MAITGITTTADSGVERITDEQTAGTGSSITIDGENIVLDGATAELSVSGTGTCTVTNSIIKINDNVYSGNQFQSSKDPNHCINYGGRALETNTMKFENCQILVNEFTTPVRIQITDLINTMVCESGATGECLLYTPPDAVLDDVYFNGIGAWEIVESFTKGFDIKVEDVRYGYLRFEVGRCDFFGFKVISSTDGAFSIEDNTGGAILDFHWNPDPSVDFQKIFINQSGPKVYEGYTATWQFVDRDTGSAVEDVTLIYTDDETGSDVEVGRWTTNSSGYLEGTVDSQTRTTGTSQVRSNLFILVNKIDTVDSGNPGAYTYPTTSLTGFNNQVRSENYELDAVTAKLEVRSYLYEAPSGFVEGDTYTITEQIGRFDTDLVPTEYASFNMVPDAGVTATKATADAYTTLENLEKFYDRAKSEWTDNDSYGLPSKNGLVAEFTGNVTINNGAGSAYAYATGTATIKASALATTSKFNSIKTGTLTVTGTESIDDLAVDGDVVLGGVQNIDGLSVTGALDFTTAGTYAFTSSVPVTINEVTNSSGGAVTINPDANVTFTTNTGPSITINTPTIARTVETDVTALIQIFDGDTQTVLASTTGTSLVYNYTGTPTIREVVQAAGYIPFRSAQITLGASNSTSTYELVEDLVYDGSHGLVYSTDLSYNATTKLLTVSTSNDGVDVYSALIDAFINESALFNKPFPLQANGPNSYLFLDDAEFDATSSINNFKKSGFEYRDTSDVATATYAGVYTLTSSVPAAFQFEYQQTAGSGTTDAINTGAIDQAIQVFGDATHGNFTTNTHLVVKAQTNDYREVRVDVVDLYGLTTVSNAGYAIATPVTQLNITTGDPGITGVTITNHGATPVSWDAGNGAKDYSITITDTGSNTGEDILEWLNYNFSLDATFQGEDPFNWPFMVEADGTKYRTERGVVEGSAGATLKGVRVVDGSDNAHPDFSEFTADDGTLGIPPVVVNFKAPNIADGANYMVLHRQTFTITSSNINTTLNEITLGNDTNGDAPAFDTTTANRHTLVRLVLADGATIPTTTPQIINNGTYRVASESSGVITIEVTEGGGAINFTSQGVNGTPGYVFVAVFETLIAEGTTSGGTGVTEQATLSEGATYRFKTIHQDNTGGPRKTTNFIDVVGSWSATAGATYNTTVDATDTAQPNLWTEPNRIADLTSYVLEDTVIDNNDTSITDFDPVEDGQDIGGVTFALEGKGFIQINAATLTKNAINLNGAIAGQDLAMWAVYEIGLLDNMWLASDQTLVFNGLSNIIIDNVEFDNTSANLLQVYGANIREKDGSPIVSANTTGPIVANVATRGNVGLTETGTSGLTASEAANLAVINSVDSKVDIIDTNVDAILLDTNELQTDWADSGRLDTILDATATQALLTTVDGKIDTVDTVVDSIKVDTAAILIDTNELQTDWTNDGRLDLILDAAATQTSVTALQADLTAVKAKTDLLTFTVTNVLDANIEYVNAQQINGTGSDEDPWGP